MLRNTLYLMLLCTLMSTYSAERQEGPHFARVVQSSFCPGRRPELIGAIVRIKGDIEEKLKTSNVWADELDENPAVEDYRQMGIAAQKGKVYCCRSGHDELLFHERELSRVINAAELEEIRRSFSRSEEEGYILTLR